MTIRGEMDIAENQEKIIENQEKIIKLLEELPERIWDEKRAQDNYY